MDEENKRKELSEETKKQLLNLNRSIRCIVYLYIFSFVAVFILLNKENVTMNRFLSLQDYMIMNY